MKIRTVFLVMLGVYVFNLIFYGRLSQLWHNVDVPLHLLGGFLAACLGIAFWHWIKGQNKVHGMPAWAIAACVVFFAITVAVFWEFYEFLVDVTYVSRGWSRAWMQPSVQDTMKDLLMGFLGACVAAASQWKKLA